MNNIKDMNISFFDEKPNLDDLDFQHKLLNEYKNNKDIDSINNIIIHGPQSCGKTIKIYSYLCSIFDKKIYDLQNITFEEDKKIMNYKTSIYHIEINPLTLGSNEKIFINSFLKTYIQNRNIGLDIPKIILIKNAENLTKQSQMAFRKFIENNSCAKFIFEVTNLSNFISPLISRCLNFRISMPTICEIKLSMRKIAIKKNIDISDKIIEDIINESNCIHNYINLKKIYGYYMYYILTNKKFNFIYYQYFDDIYKYINNKKISLVTFQKIRELVNEMYINLIPLNELILFLFYKVSNLYKNNDKMIHTLINLTAKVDNHIKKGNKECIHVEYYIISLIDIIHNIAN